MAHKKSAAQKAFMNEVKGKLNRLKTGARRAPSSQKKKYATAIKKMGALYAEVSMAYDDGKSCWDPGNP